MTITTKPRPLSWLRHALGVAWWYLREMLDANAYQHYLERFTRNHAPGTCEADHQPLTEKEFWRDRIDNQPLESRCC
ncbi:MAG: YbdD/YjiX family protein [Propionibacteriaceae bacterium]|jgi:uncharacterized short protein YbdD (DUF466 family)|nr:YbdD/YjiX family protein [Propionibacteriaceae bacterium]